jgi:hypothetical protein|tara:strand:- start:268 stop:618 length:351 start_codon:yes stop_codon:yes gene_type:complete
MLKSGKKKANREWLRRLSSGKFMESFVKSIENGAMLHIRSGTLYRYKDSDTLQYTSMKLYNVDRYDLLPNTTFIEIESFDFNASIITVKDLGQFSLDRAVKAFKIAPKLNKRTIKF